jgi:hypothetical protein
MSLNPNAPAPAPLSPITTLQNQVAALTRHGVTAAGTAITILGGLAFLPADQVTAAIQHLQDIGTDLNKLMADFGALWVILGPVLIGLAMKGAAFAASLKGQLRSIARNPAADITPESKIIVPPPVAAAVPIPQVVPKT